MVGLILDVIDCKKARNQVMKELMLIKLREKYDSRNNSINTHSLATS